MSHVRRHRCSSFSLQGVALSPIRPVSPTGSSRCAFVYGGRHLGAWRLVAVSSAAPSPARAGSRLRLCLACLRPVSSSQLVFLGHALPWRCLGSCRVPAAQARALAPSRAFGGAFPAFALRHQRCCRVPTPVWPRYVGVDPDITAGEELMVKARAKRHAQSRRGAPAAPDACFQQWCGSDGLASRVAKGWVANIVSDMWRYLCRRH